MKGRTRRRSFLLVVTLVAASLSTLASPQVLVAEALDEPVPIYLDPDYSAEERAADLVSRMTLAEKATQMNSSMSVAIPRLGVERYAWWNEALHGVSREGRINNSNPAVIWNTTSYPISLSLGSTWNPELQHREAQMIADEAREVFRDNRFNLNFYSPTINLARDPRWGRNDEAFSEDPLLTAAMGSAFVTGMEGKNLEGTLLDEAEGYLKTTTTIKHYTANNSEFDRRTGTANMDDRALREYYTAPYRAIAESADVASIMTSYGRVNGTPATANVYLLDTLARQTFGFNGYFTADCDSIYEMQRGHRWVPPGYDVPVDRFTRHAFALGAGLDLDCNRGYADNWNYGNTLPSVIDMAITTPKGLVTEDAMDVSLVRLFTARMRLGEFDDPETVPWVREARERVPAGTWTDGANNGAITMTPERLQMAREVGQQALVLLENHERDGTDPLLPLEVPTEGDFSVIVLGQYANPSSMYLGGYSSNQGASGRVHHVNPYRGIKQAIEAVNPDAQVDTSSGILGTGSASNPYRLDQAVVASAGDYDVAIVVAGTDQNVAREDRDRTSLRLPGVQQDLIEAVAAINPDTVAYMETIGSVNVEDFKNDVAALLWSSYNGQRKGEALADVLLGGATASGRLPFTWYQTVDQLPPINDYHLRPTDTNPGRTYMYFDGEISYPFGYGLSYTSFGYTGTRVDKTVARPHDTLRVTTTVTNQGTVRGAEVVQLYVATPGADPSLERPIKRLVAFERVELEPGQAAEVSLAVDVEDLAFYDETAERYVLDQGVYELQVARSSADSDIQAVATTTVNGSIYPYLAVVTAKPRAESDIEQDIEQRVFYDVGDMIDPQLTIALSDDQLYGYTFKGESAPLPKRMQVTLKSSRPDVVSTTKGHTRLRVKEPGVATITATVRDGQIRETASFVVYVNAPDEPLEE
jgi:beta-glucosidase